MRRVSATASWALEYWPWILLATAFLVGAFVAGPGVGLVTSMMLFPIAGAACVLRNVRRRRRHTEPTTRRTDVLHRDASEVVDTIAIAYLRALGRHRSLVVVMWLALVAIIAGLWFIAGRGWAVAAVVYMLAMVAVMAMSAVIRRTRSR